MAWNSLRDKRENNMGLEVLSSSQNQGWSLPDVEWDGVGRGGGSERKEQGHQDTHVAMSVNHPESICPSWVTMALTKCSCLGSGRGRAGCHTCSVWKQAYSLVRQSLLPVPWHAPPCSVFWPRALPSLCHRASLPARWLLTVGTALYTGKRTSWRKPVSALTDSMSGRQNLALALKVLGMTHCPVPLGSSQSNGIQPTYEVLLCKLIHQTRPPISTLKRLTTHQGESLCTVRTHRRDRAHHHLMMSFPDSKVIFKFCSNYEICLSDRCWT